MTKMATTTWLVVSRGQTFPPEGDDKKVKCRRDRSGHARLMASEKSSSIDT